LPLARVEALHEEELREALACELVDLLRVRVRVRVRGYKVGVRGKGSA